MPNYTTISTETDFDSIVRDDPEADKVVVTNRRKLHLHGGTDTEGNPVPLCFHFDRGYSMSESRLRRLARLNRGRANLGSRGKPGAPVWEEKDMAVYPPGFREWCGWCVDAYYRLNPEKLPEDAVVPDYEPEYREVVPASDNSRLPHDTPTHNSVHSTPRRTL